MKKSYLLIGFILVASNAYSVDLTLNRPFIIRQTTNTFTNPNAWQSSTTFINATMGINGVTYIWPNSLSANNCLKVDGSGNLSWGTCGGGGGGGGGAVFVFDGKTANQSSTFTVRGFPVQFDGVGFSTIEVLNSSPTWGGSHTFLSSTTFLAPVSSLTSQGNFIAVGSMTAYGLISSTGGFIVSQGTAAQLGMAVGANNLPTLYWIGDRLSGLAGGGSNHQVKVITNGAVGPIFDSNVTLSAAGSQFLGVTNTNQIPQFSFSGDGTTGLFQNGSILDLIFMLNGREIMRFDRALSSVILGAIGRTGATFTVSTATVNQDVIQVDSGTVKKLFTVDGSSSMVWGSLYVVGGSTISGHTTFLTSVTANASMSINNAEVLTQNSVIFSTQINNPQRDGIDILSAGAFTNISSMSAIDPFGANDFTFNAKHATFTVLGATNPYTVTSLDPKKWDGFAGDTNSCSQDYSGTYISTRIGLAWQYDFLEFKNSTYNFCSTQLTVGDNILPSTFGFTVDWAPIPSSGTQGNTCVWCMQAVALSSGASLSNLNFGSSVCVFSALTGTYNVMRTTMSPSVTIGNTNGLLFPGDRVIFQWFRSGGGTANGRGPDGHDTFEGFARGLGVNLYMKQDNFSAAPFRNP